MKIPYAATTQHSQINKNFFRQIKISESFQAAEPNCWCKFVCLKYSEAKQTETVEFEAEKCSLQGHARR